MQGADTQRPDRNGRTAEQTVQAMTESNGVLAAAARRVLRVLQSTQHRFSNHAIRSNAAYRAERFEEACAEYGRAEAALEDAEGELVAARLKASGGTGEQARVRALAVVRCGKVAGVTLATRATLAHNHGRAATRLPKPR